MTAAAAAFSLAREGAAQTGGWLLITPPPIPEKRALMKVYGAGSDAEVKAAVASLPGEEQVRLVTKVYEILTIPTVAARTEALLDVLQDPSAPVSRWRRVERFESAAACERQRQLALQSFERAAAQSARLVPRRRRARRRGVDDLRGIGGRPIEPLRPGVDAALALKALTCYTRRRSSKPARSEHAEKK